MSRFKFSFCWKIEWFEFNQLSTRDACKSFVTSHKNVPFYWRARVSAGLEGADTKNGIFFSLTYEDGPLASLNGITRIVKIIQPGSPCNQMKFDQCKWEVDRGKSWGYLCFGFRNAKSFQEGFKLLTTEPFYCHVTLRIPPVIFSYSMQPPSMLVNSESWLHKLFEKIEDPDKAKFSDAKMISNEGKIFYCDKVVIGEQSAELAAMFRYPPAADKVENEYEFPTMSTAALKALLEFLYTGKASFADLSTKAIIEVADAAEQYNFEKLKEACAAFLWKRLVLKPNDAFDVVLFGNLHQNLKYLKHRALDVLTDNFEKFSLQDDTYLKERFGTDELVSEFKLYVYRRLDPIFIGENDDE